MIFLYFLGVLHRESEGFMILKRISRWISVHLNNIEKTSKLFGLKQTKFGRKYTL